VVGLALARVDELVQWVMGNALPPM
jgi:hypothetical protein